MRISEIKPIVYFFILAALTTTLSSNPLPFVKVYESGTSVFNLTGYNITAPVKELENETAVLKECLNTIGIKKTGRGTPISLKLSEIELPVNDKKYRELIYKQGYHLRIQSEGILIESPSPEGIYYGIQTFLKCIEDTILHEVDISDWPDIPIRMIMVDPARQNENFEYYKRLIDFCGQYKINRIQIHLTDAQTACLYHEDYPELLHPHAWTKEDISTLCEFAARRHIQIVPEIESFGHSRMFTRMKDAKDYLHQTEMMESDNPWIIIDIPGYTNMLCPASDKAITYLSEMYQTATAFNSDYIHIGFDEVDLSNCIRCNDKFGKLSGARLFQEHMNHCVRIAGDNYEKIGVWGDMIIKHPEILDNIPNAEIIINDWYYFPDVTANSVDLFLEKGFEVIACPALVCWPHIMLPDHNNYTNISRFTRIAREKELLGVNTTIWVPMRYMSDILWTGIAFAAVQAWGGSNWNETEFYHKFVQDYFGSPQGEEFRRIWLELCSISLHLDTFFAGTWNDNASLENARRMATEKSGEFNNTIKHLDKLQKEFSTLGHSITRHIIEFNVIEQTIALRSFVLQHILASNYVKTDPDRLKELDQECQIAFQWIEQDWDRNRYPDDPNKNGMFVPTDHILYRFRRMHEFHQVLLNNRQQPD